jgi:hypothetical protein
LLHHSLMLAALDTLFANFLLASSSCLACGRF